MKYCNSKGGFNAEIPSAAEISMQHEIVNMLDRESHHNPQTPKVFFQWHTQYDPTTKHSHCKTVYAKELEIKKMNWRSISIEPKLGGIWSVLRCIFVPNLAIAGELWHAQAQNGVNFDFWVPFDLEGHDQSSYKPMGLLTKVFYISGPNLVILA